MMQMVAARKPCVTLVSDGAVFVEWRWKLQLRQQTQVPFPVSLDTPSGTVRIREQPERLSWWHLTPRLRQ